MSDLWTVLDILKWTTDYFQKNSIDHARHTAELLLAHVLDLERIQLYLQFDRPLTDQERAVYKVMIKRCVEHEPVQYITGEAYCMGLRFKVNKNVLIPRFDTEILIEKALDIVKNNELTKVFDIGTGSGVIAVCLAHFATELKVGASDISNDALNVTRDNVKEHGLDERIEVREGDLLAPWVSDIQSDSTIMITANLPYVRENEWESLLPEVRSFEPRSALVSGCDGLDHYKALISQVSVLPCRGRVLLELGVEQADLLRTYIIGSIPTSEIEVVKDISGKDRCLIFSF